MTSRPRSARAASMEIKGATPHWPRSRWRTSSIDSMSRTRVETRARARVLQALYAWDLRAGSGAQLDTVASQIWDDLSVSPEERKLAGALIRTFSYHQAAIDTALAE